MNDSVSLAAAITALAAEKRAVGYKYDAEERILPRSEAFCREEFLGLDTVMKGLRRGMDRHGPPAGSPTGDPAGIGRPGQRTRPLARPPRHRRLRPAARAVPRPARYVPHIYTDPELAALFAQTDRCRYCSEVSFRHLVMPVLFRTVYACGLSGSEARLLRPGDVEISTA